MREKEEEKGRKEEKESIDKCTKKKREKVIEVNGRIEKGKGREKKDRNESNKYR